MTTAVEHGREESPAVAAETYRLLARSITLGQAGPCTFLEMQEEFVAGASRFFAAHGG